VQRYAPELNKRCRRELRPTNGSWRVDETYICQGGSWRYLYRAVDSTGATVEFWFSAERDAAAAKQFFQKALQASGHPRPRVITVDGNPSYPKVIAELKQERKLGRRCRCRTCPYLNNVVEQDHRGIKRRVNASQGFRSFDGAWRTIRGYEVLHMIPERPNEVVAERGCPWADSVHPGNPRIESRIVDRRDWRFIRFRRENCFCNTIVPALSPVEKVGCGFDALPNLSSQKRAEGRF